MNYGLALRFIIEEIIRLLEIERGEKASLADSPASTDDDGGKDIEEQALRSAVEEIHGVRDALSLGHIMPRRSAWAKLYSSSTLTPSIQRYRAVRLS